MTGQVKGLSLGIGKHISVHPKVDMNIILLYNILHKSGNMLTPQPWSVKFGFNLSELAMHKK